VHPIAVCDSEKDDKKLWHSSFRAKCKQHIRSKLALSEDWDFPIHFRVVADVYCFGKDGKRWMRILDWKRGKVMFSKDIDDDGYLYSQKYLHQLLGK
jgi:hypothetical protein